MAIYRLPHAMLNKTHVRTQIRKALLTSEICDQSKVQQIGDYLHYARDKQKKILFSIDTFNNIRLARV
jgi:hypothetical protein